MYNEEHENKVLNFLQRFIDEKVTIGYFDFREKKDLSIKGKLIGIVQKQLFIELENGVKAIPFSGYREISIENG